MSASEQSLMTNQFLVAMPSLTDPNFNRTVTLLCQHDENGALGIVINREAENLSLEIVLTQLEIHDAEHHGNTPVYNGGPVQTQLGMVLHQPLGEWESTLPIGPELGLTTSKDVLQAIAGGSGPQRYMLALGYAGWGPGQLEQEMVQNAWLTVPADPEIIFTTPLSERWSTAAGQLGVDISTLTSGAGHA